MLQPAIIVVVVVVVEIMVTYGNDWTFILPTKGTGKSSYTQLCVCKRVRNRVTCVRNL